ncbi:MAG TPA: hypothetical protein VJT16_02470 [Streptosporangiaceae bacterium]|nr:hypothetical protein [Streptosporangiaceae bacterium]
MRPTFTLRTRAALRSAAALSMISALALTFGPAASASAHTPDPRSVAFARDAQPYGLPMATWGQLISQWIYAQPFDVNPAYDQTGADCAIDQHGPAWFIPPIFAPPGTHHPIIQNASRTCTVPAHRGMLLDIGSIVDEYPCPDPTFTPPPGESLYDFLIADAKPVMDSVNELDVSVDGTPPSGGPRRMHYRDIPASHHRWLLPDGQTVAARRPHHRRARDEHDRR